MRAQKLAVANSTVEPKSTMAGTYIVFTSSQELSKKVNFEYCSTDCMTRDLLKRNVEICCNSMEVV